MDTAQLQRFDPRRQHLDTLTMPYPTPRGCGRIGMATAFPRDHHRLAATGIGDLLRKITAQDHRIKIFVEDTTADRSARRSEDRKRWHSSRTP